MTNTAASAPQNSARLATPAVLAGYLAKVPAHVLDADSSEKRWALVVAGLRGAIESGETTAAGLASAAAIGVGAYSDWGKQAAAWIGDVLSEGR